jgi:hypothetical protein
MFCTGDPGEAVGYGKLYYIFPIGDFKFVWAAGIRDLWSAYDDILHRRDWDSDEEIYEVFMDTIVEPQHWSDQHLMSAIKSENEIAIRCDSYYGINYDAVIDADIENGLELLLKL